MEVENWLPVKDYEGHYEVSDLGRVRSVKFNKCKILKKGYGISKYEIVKLSKNCVLKSKAVHQLVAIAFLGHTPCGHNLVVNHINFNRQDNRVCNLEIVTQRQNLNQKHRKSYSKYTGVSFRKDSRKKPWYAQIEINKFRIYLGSYKTEIEAHYAYEEALAKITK